jgi:hypothetical protein
MRQDGVVTGWMRFSNSEDSKASNEREPVPVAA